MTLTRDEAAQRAAIVSLTFYDVRLDLTAGGSRVRVGRAHRRHTQVGTETFVDFVPEELLGASLNGAPLPTEACDGRPSAADWTDRAQRLVVEARMDYSHDGQGLHRALDPADGESDVYSRLFMDAAPRVFACFD